MISLMFFHRVYTCQTKAKECCNRKWWCLLTPPGSIIYPSGPTSDSPWRYLWIVHQFSVIVSIVYSLISYAMVTYFLSLWSPLVSIHFGCYQLQDRIACTICQPKTERIQMATFRRLTFKFWRSSELPWRWLQYRNRLHSMLQVAWVLQASWGRSGKQYQEQNSPNLKHWL